MRVRARVRSGLPPFYDNKVAFLGGAHGLIGMWVGWHELLKVILIAALSGILIGGIAILKNNDVSFVSF